jgi:hypothetical protein
VPVIGGSFPQAGDAERLAWVAAAQDIHGRDGGPVGDGDVAEVGHVGVVVGEDRGGARVGVGDPCEVSAEYLLYGHVEAAVSGAQAADGGPVRDGQLPGDDGWRGPVGERPQVGRRHRRCAPFGV